MLTLPLEFTRLMMILAPKIDEFLSCIDENTIFMLRGAGGNRHE